MLLELFLLLLLLLPPPPAEADSAPLGFLLLSFGDLDAHGWSETTRLESALEDEEASPAAAAAVGRAESSVACAAAGLLGVGLSAPADWTAAAPLLGGALPAGRSLPVETGE